MTRRRDRTTARTCRTCSAPIRFIREVDSGRVLVINDRPVEGGTVVMLGDRGQVVPAGRGVAFSLHACERRVTAAEPEVHGDPFPF